MSSLPKLVRSWSLLGALLSGVLIGASAATALEVGEKAPDFTLPGTTGEKISLSQFRGKWLIANNTFSPSEDILKVAREMTGKQ